jgi:two-component system OmpR family response regulator
VSADRAGLVLVVDDDADIARFVEMNLVFEGFQVVVAYDGQEALAVIEQRRPDLVLLDVMMPRMDGPTMLMRMHADPAFAHVPVIFMTAKALPQEIARFREMGAVAVIPKPFDPIQLGPQVVAIWEGLPRA